MSSLKKVDNSVVTVNPEFGREFCITDIPPSREFPLDGEHFAERDRPVSGVDQCRDSVKNIPVSGVDQSEDCVKNIPVSGVDQSEDCVKNIPVSVVDQSEDDVNNDNDSNSSIDQDYWSDLDNSDLYDTDLDTHKSEQNNREDTGVDEEDQFIGRNIYIKACESCGYFAPHRTILRDMEKRCMDLSHRNIGPTGIKPLCIALMDNLRVEQLVLDGNDIKEEGCRYTSQLLLENLALSRLSLASNSLGYEAAWYLSLAVGRSKTLQYLNLSDNKIGDEAITAFCKGLAKNESLITLNISKNTFGEEGAKAIGAALAENHKLQELYANWNFIRGAGAVGIFKSLKENTALRVLHIAWNGLGYEGSVGVSNALKNNSTLSELDVTNNRFNWECADLIANGLRNNTTLEILKIGDNPLTTTGAQEIVDSVSHDKSKIRVLDMINVSVLAETELQAMTIEQRRKFHLIHGGVVRTHDKLGEKKEKEIKAIERVLGYMKALGLRPVEMLRDFDKSANYQVTQGDFINRLKQKRIPLHNFEMEALAKAIAAKGKNGEDHIDYRKLVDAVKDHIVEERTIKIKERTKMKKTKAYHKQLLDLQLPSEVLTDPEIDDTEELDRLGDFRAPSVLTTSYTSIKSAVPSHAQKSTSRLPSLKSISKIDINPSYKSFSTSTVSMCGPLEQSFAKGKRRKKKRSHGSKIKS